MSVGNDFWNQQINTGDKFSQLEFIARNYNHILKIYRIICKQEKETYEKKLAAHNELQELRNKIDLFRQKKIKLLKQELLDHEARIAYLEELREEEDLIYMNGKPLNYDEVIVIIEKWQCFLNPLEKADRSIRESTSKVIDRSLKIILAPIALVGGKKLKGILDGIRKEIVEDFRTP